MHIAKTIAVFAALSLPLAAMATPITIYNTGTAGIGVQDPYYTLISEPSDATQGPALGTTNHPAWYPNQGTANWINNTGAYDQGAQPNGFYVYTTTFDILAGDDPSTAIIDLLVAVDDSGTVSLNGNVVYDGGLGYASPTSVVISSGIETGTNTLTFTVDNSGGAPTGLFVEASGTVDPLPPPPAVPEPSSLMLFGTGIFAVAGAVRRRFKA
jgi:hypothetical protein